MPFSARVRFFAPTGPDVISASTGVLIPSVLALFAAFALLIGAFDSLFFSFSIARFIFRFHCILSSESAGPDDDCCCCC